MRALCSIYGTVMRLRYFTAGRDQPFTNAMRAFCMNEQGELKTGFRIVSGRIYVLVEYATIKQAGAAFKAMQAEQHDWRIGGIEVGLLHRKPKSSDSPAMSQAGSCASSREGSPFSASALIVQRARANSLNARLQRERLPNFEALTLGPTVAISAGGIATSSSTTRTHSPLHQGHSPSFHSFPTHSHILPHGPSSLSPSGGGSSLGSATGRMGSLGNLSVKDNASGVGSGHAATGNGVMVTSSGSGSVASHMRYQRERSSSLGRTGLDELARWRGTGSDRHDMHSRSPQMSPQTLRRLVEPEMGAPRVSAAAGGNSPASSTSISGGGKGVGGSRQASGSANNGRSGNEGSESDNWRGSLSTTVDNNIHLDTITGAVSSISSADHRGGDEVAVGPTALGLSPLATSMPFTSQNLSSSPASSSGVAPRASSACSSSPIPSGMVVLTPSASPNRNTSPSFAATSPSIAARSSLSRTGSPPLWSTVASSPPRTSALISPGGSTGILRQPSGPNGTRGFMQARV